MEPLRGTAPARPASFLRTPDKAVYKNPFLRALDGCVFEVPATRVVCTEESVGQLQIETSDPLELAEEERKRKLICRSRSEQDLRRRKENLYKQMNVHQFTASQRDAVLKRAKPAVVESEQDNQSKPAGGFAVSTPVLLAQSMFSRPLSTSQHRGFSQRLTDQAMSHGQRSVSDHGKIGSKTARPSELEEYCQRGLDGGFERSEDRSQVYCTYDMFKQQKPKASGSAMSTDAQLQRASLILTRQRAVQHADVGRSTYVQRCASRSKELKRPLEERSLCVSMLK